MQSYLTFEVLNFIMGIDDLIVDVAAFRILHFPLPHLQKIFFGQSQRSQQNPYPPKTENPAVPPITKTGPGSPVTGATPSGLLSEKSMRLAECSKRSSPKVVTV